MEEALPLIFLLHIKGRFRMTLIQSILGFIATVVAILYFSKKDKESGVDNNRLIISITGMLCMTFLFFMLVNILIAIGVLK